MTDQEKPRRGTSLSPQDMDMLDQWGRVLGEAFETPYLVGSVMHGGDYRDVDVRIPVDGDLRVILTPKRRLRAVNLAVSLWGRHVTGLPIDFQFQPIEEHQAETGVTSALGIRSRVEAADAE